MYEEPLSPLLVVDLHVSFTRGMSPAPMDRIRKRRSEFSFCMPAPFRCSRTIEDHIGLSVRWRISLTFRFVLERQSGANLKKRDPQGPNALIRITSFCWCVSDALPGYLRLLIELTFRLVIPKIYFLPAPATLDPRRIGGMPRLLIKLSSISDVS